MTGILCLDELEELARGLMSAADFAYVAGGSWDEVTLRENVAAFRRRRLRPRVLVDVGSIATSTTVLGREVAVPFGVAPMAMQGLAHPEGETATAWAASAAGVPFVASTLSTRSLEEIAGASGAATRWFQLYVHRDRGVSRELLARAVAAGYAAIVLTADLPVLGHRERELRAKFGGPAIGTAGDGLRFGNFAAARASDASFASFVDGLHDQALAWRDLEWIAAASELPLVLKGVLGSEDARLAVEHGVAGVVVSNHGGRQLDRSPPSVDVLAEVVEALDGRAEAYLDGGVRRGLDVLVALALGARAVFVGRPLFYALACGGREGVASALDLLSRELRTAMALLGVTSPAGITRRHLG